MGKRSIPKIRAAEVKDKKEMLKLLRTGHPVYDAYACAACIYAVAASRTVRNRADRSGIEGETEHSGEARADCGRGAACLLAHLSVLNLYVVSATGSAPTIPPGPIGASTRRRRTENPRRAPASERGERERARCGRENESEKKVEIERKRGVRRGTGRDISSQGELRSRNRVKRVGQTDDRRRASTALRTQKPRF